MGTIGQYCWRHACFVGFAPAQGAQTPLIARFQAGKAVVRSGGAEVISPATGKLQKSIGHDSADHVPPFVVFVGAAEAIAVKAGHWTGTAAGQFRAEDIFRIHSHLWSFALRHCGH